MDQIFDFDLLYQKYQSQYKKSSRVVKGMVAEMISDKDEFISEFKLVKTRLKEAGGHRYSATQIAETIAKNDVYKYSYKQARGVINYLKQLESKTEGRKAAVPKLVEVRMGNIPESVYDEARKMYHKMKKKYSKSMWVVDATKKAKAYVASHVFGSP